MLTSGLHVYTHTQTQQQREARWRKCERSGVLLGLGRVVIPHVSGGAFFSRHGAWLISFVEEAGASEGNCGKGYFGWYNPVLSAQAGTMKDIATSQISQVTCSYRASAHGPCPGSSASAPLLKSSSSLCKLHCNLVCSLTLDSEATQ